MGLNFINPLTSTRLFPHGRSTISQLWVYSRTCNSLTIPLCRGGSALALQIEESSCKEKITKNQWNLTINRGFLYSGQALRRINSWNNTFGRIMRGPKSIREVKGWDKVYFDAWSSAWAILFCESLGNYSMMDLKKGYRDENLAGRVRGKHVFLSKHMTRNTCTSWKGSQQRYLLCSIPNSHESKIIEY